jgi:predicted alpha/beta hydrolase
VLVAGATGVSHRLYSGIAEHLAGRGLAVLRFDYRGVGESLEGHPRAERVAMHDWGERDMPGGLDYLAGRFPGLPLGLLGHSSGGWSAGLMPDVERLAAMVTVASQDGYWGHWPWRSRPRVLWFWYFVMPVTLALCGYLPRWVLGGEPLPAGIAREWSRFCRDRDFIRPYARAAARGGPTGYERFRGALRAYAVAGDVYAPPPSVERFLDLYPNAAPRQRVVFDRPGALGERPGHFNVFRPSFRDSLWSEIGEWLAARLA